MESISPFWIEEGWIVLGGNSIAKAALKYIDVSLKGLRQDIVLTILFFLSKNRISMENRIKKVCMELQGSKTRAWPFFNSFLPKRPFILLKGVLAITASSATTKELVLLIILMIFRVLVAADSGFRKRQRYYREGLCL